MERFIGGSMQLRMNQLTHQLEHRPVTEGIPAPDGWAPMTDTVENSLWCSMRRDGLEADLFHLRTLLLSDFAPRYHPLEEFLEKAGPWDGVTDHIGNLAAMVHPPTATPIVSTSVSAAGSSGWSPPRSIRRW